MPCSLTMDIKKSVSFPTKEQEKELEKKSPKTYSVWVRFESVPSKDANEAIRTITKVLLSHLPLQYKDFKVLKELMRDFYPEVK